MHSVQNMKLVVVFSSIARNILGARMRCDKNVEERELHLHFYLRIQGVLLALQCGHCTANQSSSKL